MNPAGSARRSVHSRWVRVFSIALVAIVTMVAVAFAGQPESGTFTSVAWTSGVAQPQSNSEAQGVVVNDRLYLFGGFDSTKPCCTPTNRAYVYDPADGVWQPLAPMPPENGTPHGGVTHAGMATDGRDIFWAGGYTSNAAGTGQIFGTREVWRYNVGANTYTRMPDLPVERAAGQLEYLQGKLHYFGGTNLARTQDVGDHYVLDIAAGAQSWSVAAPLANPRHHMGSGVLNGRIYAVGGQHGHDAQLVTVQDVDYFDPATGQWVATPADLPATAGRGHISGSTFEYAGRMIVAGGESAHGQAVASVVAYRPGVGWRTLTSLPAARSSGVAAALATRLYFTTGPTFKGVPLPASRCVGYSELTCAQVKAPFPLSTTFSGNDGGLYDRQEQDLAMTMVQASSNGGSYRPELLDVTGGALELRTTAGIQFLRDNGSPPPENALDNGLGIGLGGGRRMRVETTLLDSPIGSGRSEQAGIWFGPDEDNYAKAVVISTGAGDRVQLVKEVAGASGTADVINSAVIPADAPSIRLALVADPAGTVRATYQLANGAAQTVGTLSVPASFFDGSRLAAPVTQAGVRVLTGLFATHRQATSPLKYRFGDFTVVDADPPSGTPQMTTTPTRLVTNDVAGGADGQAHAVTIRNSGGGYLRLADAVLEGQDADQFKITRQPAVAVAGGQETTAEVAFAPTTPGPKDARLRIRSQDPTIPADLVALRGLGTKGLGGTNEPSLQWVLDTHEIPVQVGDDDPSTAPIHSEPERQRAPLLGEEIAGQVFERAGSGPVTIEPLAVFGPSTPDPVVKFGVVPAGAASPKIELFSVRNTPTSNPQTLEPEVTGSVSFTPATERFGLYTVWPAFGNREVFSEDALNTFAGTTSHQARIYRYRTPAGAVVPDAYVVAFEESTSGRDTQDLVFAVRNVRPVRLASQSRVLVENLDTVPYENRIAFSRIQNPNVTFPNGVHDIATVRVHNQSLEQLVLRSVGVVGPWVLRSPPTFPRTLQPGQFVDVDVQFVAQEAGARGGLYEGRLTVDTDDPVRPAVSFDLAGYWQIQSENNKEPSVSTLLQAFGYRTKLLGSGQTLSNDGELVRVGEEVHSQYWRRANTSNPVSVRQLAAFHSQGDIARIYTTLKATSANSPSSPPASALRLTHYGLDGQTFLPRRNAEPPSGPASAEFTPSTAQTGTTTGTDPEDGTFGLRIDPEYSDWKMNRTGNGIDTNCLNKQATDSSVVCGHHLRTWPIRDRAGVLVPNAWLVIMDYSGINYDFNDNVYLVSNIRPESPEVDPAVCRPVACSAVAVGRPYELTFEAGLDGTAVDANGLGTGFTYVDPPLLGQGYRKEKLNLTGGQLRIGTTAGLAVGEVNSQDNTLGVGMGWDADDPPREQVVQTRLVNVPAMTGRFEQAGLWFGRDEDNHAKLHVWSGGSTPQIEFLTEQDGTRSARAVSPPVALTGRSVDLELELDPVARRVTARWNRVGEPAQQLASAAVPASWFDQVPEAIDHRMKTFSFAGVFASHRNAASPLTFSFDHFRVGPVEGTRPSVTAVRPSDGATGVVRDISIGTDLSLPQGGIDSATVTDQTVRLFRDSDNVRVPGTPGTTGGGDAIVFTPADLLAANTKYRFEVTDGLRDTSGVPFEPFTSTFTTGTQTSGTPASGVRFDDVALPAATAPSEYYTVVTIGPDGKLYAALSDGRIRRFGVRADGTLGPPETLTSLVPGFNAEDPATMRLVTGLRFDPASTSQNLVVWVSHSTWGFDDMPDWGGKVTRLSGADLGQVRDYVVNLPRSIRDHVTNGIDFGPDGKMYVLQGSNSAMGAADTTWGNRPERLLNAAVLQVDPARITVPPLDVKTDEGGTYDPFAANAAVRLYATGLRNSFDLVWHSNGRLYVPTNGSAAGGNTPETPSPLPSSCARRIDSGSAGAYTGPAVPGLSSVAQTQHDYLFRVVQNGYYGHPNPARCEWVLNGGNPTSSTDSAQVDAYPVGTQPDRNRRGAAFDFGLNKSPNGIVEYKSNAFDGRLKGLLLAVRYSQNDDIIVLHPGGPNDDIVGADVGTAGMTGFKDPLDLAELPGTGFLYVSEYDTSGSDQRLTLLRPFGACVPMSPFPCSQTGIPAQYEATWEPGSTTNGLQDRNGATTGLTAIQPNGPGGEWNGYRPDLLDRSDGRLKITATNGIQYRKPGTTTGQPNLLDNALGVGVGGTQAMRFETTLVNPHLGSRSEQAGLWLGPDQDNYLKLVVLGTSTSGVTHHRVQLLREVDGVSAAGDDEVHWPPSGTPLPSPAPNWSPTTLRLVLEVNPATGLAEAWYGIGTGELQRLGALTVPAKLLDGTLVPANARTAGMQNFGGIFATRRANTDPGAVEFSFEDFRYTGS